MTTHDLIKKLQEIDPEGNNEVMIIDFDGYCCDISEIKISYVDDGIEYEDEKTDPNCVIIEVY